MKIDFRFVSTRHYDWGNIAQWFWYFRKMRYVRGFTIRLLGIHLTVFENNATQKLINIHHERSTKENQKNPSAR